MFDWEYPEFYVGGNRVVDEFLAAIVDDNDMGRLVGCITFFQGVSGNDFSGMRKRDAHIILYTSPPNRLFWFSGMKSSRRGRRMTAESGVFSRTYLKAEYPMPSLIA